MCWHENWKHARRYNIALLLYTRQHNRPCRSCWPRTVSLWFGRCTTTHNIVLSLSIITSDGPRIPTRNQRTCDVPVPKHLADILWSTREREREREITEGNLRTTVAEKAVTNPWHWLGFRFRVCKDHFFEASRSPLFALTVERERERERGGGINWVLIPIRILSLVILLRVWHRVTGDSNRSSETRPHVVFFCLDLDRPTRPPSLSFSHVEKFVVFVTNFLCHSSFFLVCCSPW